MKDNNHRLHPNYNLNLDLPWGEDLNLPKNSYKPQPSNLMPQLPADAANNR